MRTQAEIQFQIDGLLEEKAGLPEYSFFDDPNWEAFDAQIAVLKGEAEASDFAADDDYVYDAANMAEDWLKGLTQENLFG